MLRSRQSQIHVVSYVCDLPPLKTAARSEGVDLGKLTNTLYIKFARFVANTLTNKPQFYIYVVF